MLLPRQSSSVHGLQALRLATGCIRGCVVQASPSSSASAGASSIPIIDFSPLQGLPWPLPASGAQQQPRALSRLAQQVYDACSTWGAFVAVGHGVPQREQAHLVGAAREFFALPTEQKMGLHVASGGVAWRGYMPLGGEATKGRVDRKEGLYLGLDHAPSHPLVRAGAPLHGTNRLPDAQVPELRQAVASYLQEAGRFGDRTMQLLSLALGLDPQHIHRHVTCGEPLLLFRAFSYPPQPAPAPGEASSAAAQREQQWGIGAHSDYGLWTIIKQEAPGLQFEHLDLPGQWVDVPHVEGGLVCNVGDVLDRMTDGRFKSRRHRARNLSPTEDRLTFPLFYDPAWSARMAPLPLGHLPPHSDPGQAERWASTSIRRLEGEYSQFLAKKVRKVFGLPDAVDAFEGATAPSTRFQIQVSG